MNPSRPLAQKKNLLLAFDAFGTLFYPKEPVTKQYARFADAHGIRCSRSDISIRDTFKSAYKYESSLNPNYGKATGLGAEKWWASVITRTFQPFLRTGQEVPQPLISALLTQFSTSAGYALYPDVLPFFQMLRSKKKQSSVPGWKWDKTVVGIVTNSDSRVPEILNSFGLRVGPRRVGTAAQRQHDPTLEDDVSFVVLSYDVGYEKPDPRIFDAAVEMGQAALSEDAAGVPIEDFERLYVGDSIKMDYFGARRAGWHALLLDRESQDDNLEDSPVVRHVAGADVVGMSADREVEMIRGLGALRRWPLGKAGP